MEEDSAESSPSPADKSKKQQSSGTKERKTAPSSAAVTLKRSTSLKLVKVQTGKGTEYFMHEEE